MNSPIPYFAITGLLLLFAWGCVRLIPFYRQQLTVSLPQHLAIDGLRGFLALGVFFHHVVITYYSQRSGVWAEAPSQFYTLTGHVAVSLFFMVTGFLFWEKAIVSNGKIALKPYFKSRIRRIGPAYVMSLMLILLVLAVPLGNFGLQHLRINDIGDALMFKGIRSVSDINGVYWTLVWEWRFYLLLPLAALFVKGHRAWVPAALTVIYVLYYPQKVLIINFIFGAGCAAILHKLDMKRIFTSRWMAPIGLGLLAAVFVWFDRGYGIAQSLLLFGFFAAVAHGNSLFGLLTSAPARLLGMISYSVYLLHCIVLYASVHLLGRVVTVSALEPLAYWIWMAGIAVLVVVVALINYRMVEHPFLNKR